MQGEAPPVHSAGSRGGEGPADRERDDLLARFVALGDPQDPGTLLMVFHDVAAAAAGECLEALVVSTHALAAALRRAGHDDPSRALSLPGGGGMHVTDTRDDGSDCLVAVDAVGYHVVVVDADRGVDGAPDALTGIRIASGSGGTHAGVERLVADLADDRISGCEVEVSNSHWDHVAGTVRWKPGLRWVDPSSAWADVAVQLDQACVAMGVDHLTRRTRSHMAHRRYVPGDLAVALGVEVARAGGLVVGSETLGVLSAMAARVACLLVESVLADLVAVHAACLAHGGAEIVLSSPRDGDDSVAATADGAGGGTLRMRSRGEVVEVTLAMDGKGELVRVSVRAGLDPGPMHRDGDVAMFDICALAVEAGALRTLTPPAPSGRAMSFLGTLPHMVPSCRGRLDDAADLAWHTRP